MSTLRLVWCYLKAKPLNTVLNIFLLALGVAVITVLVLFGRQMEEKIAANTKGIDLVVGAKGSPLQLILCSVFHVDFPTGNIKLSEAGQLAKHRLVKNAIPLALGDSYQNFRIVGTNHSYADLYHGELQTGEWWKDDLEVTIGSTAASILKINVGDSFASAHGLMMDGPSHEESAYVVKGILKPTNSILDNLILTNVESVWRVHEHKTPASLSKITNASALVPSVEESDSAREITSLLIKYKNPIAVMQLPRYINTQTNMQAASPAFETARLFSILGFGADALLGFAYVLIFISALSLFIALYNSLKERQYDLAIMRSMGASRAKLFFTTILEGTVLTILGSLLGLALGHAAIYAFTQVVEESRKAGITSFVFYEEETFLLFGSVLLGVICSFIPALQAYRMNIHKVLAGS